MHLFDQDSVEKWLEELQLSEYTELFHREGYKKAEDIVNLKELNVTQLQAMGIKKKGLLSQHTHTLLKYTFYPY